MVVVVTKDQKSKVPIIVAEKLQKYESIKVHVISKYIFIQSK